MDNWYSAYHRVASSVNNAPCDCSSSSPPPLAKCFHTLCKLHSERNIHPCAILVVAVESKTCSLVSHFCLVADTALPPNSKLESRECHFITGSNFHQSTTPTGHLIAKMKGIWGVLEPTCGSHMTGLGGARTASDDQGRLGGSGGLRKRCKLPSHGPSSQAPILPNIGPQLLPTDILCL